ncbi:SDR family oxidoreductase [Kribbella sp. CA-253562]|uniref:SDR family oxidoreductase n=1 Tax=Kribbella sp. CA-253562 TaxID=3239942 RepID=UPI003D8B3D14
MNIEGSVALVTGANRGIGLAFVDELLARGAAKVYAAARDRSTVPEQDRVVAVQLDVTDHDRVVALAGELPDVDLVINNAGIGHGTAALDPDAITAARAELEANYFGPLVVSRAFAPVLRTNGGGAIVNMLSMLSFLTADHLATYSASKAAAWSLSNALRLELAGQGTAVVGVHAGFVDTDLVAALDLTKIPASAVAVAALEAVESGTPEVLVDEPTRRAKAALSRDQKLVYPDSVQEPADRPTKIAFIFDNPADSESFEAGYADLLARASKLPGVQRVEASRVWPKEDGSPTPAYRLVDLYFTGYGAASDAVTTPEAAELFPSVFELATGGVRIAFADVENS